ncbi:hypothetical protein CEQ90_19370 [Lewinellaceae bacterium SD302]|nr:hypothetical protein CEQ90_19370 [Lewinellaceae bacterium SD302]
MGTDWGATVQLRMPYVHKNFVVEGIAQSSFQRDEGIITILGKQHRPILSRRLNLFYGAGPHLGWSNETDSEGQAIKGAKGISGVIGGELTLGGVNLSYDFKPAVNLSGGSKTVYTQSAISVRAIILKRGDIFDKKKERERNRDRKKRRRAKEREKRGKGRFEFWKKGNDR